MCIDMYIRDICSLKACQFQTLNLIVRNMRQLNAVLLIFEPIAYIWPHISVCVHSTQEMNILPDMARDMLFQDLARGMWHGKEGGIRMSKLNA